ncbi:MAG: acyl-CoA thioesterase [Desulfamplus sp.]|nr:acyl-CoA thioesterase [Desulfamplus sp.]
MKKPYFKPSKDDPPPLRTMVSRNIRFHEVDMLRIVWHGHYAGFFEDARIRLGTEYKIGYLDLYTHGILTPIKTVYVDYIQPLRFMEKITIEGILHYSPAARINSEYVIRNEGGDVAATGFTVQMMLDMEWQLYLTQPEYYRDFCRRWRAGEL